MLLADGVDLSVFFEQLNVLLAEADLDVEVVSWSGLSTFYNKVKDMFDVLFAFLFAIVFLIAAMSVVNMVSMAVLERTREIGTLRAMGANRSQVTRLFVLESALLAVFGIFSGIILTILIWCLTGSCVARHGCLEFLLLLLLGSQGLAARIL